MNQKERSENQLILNRSREMEKEGYIKNEMRKHLRYEV